MYHFSGFHHSIATYEKNTSKSLNSFSGKITNQTLARATMTDVRTRFMIAGYLQEKSRLPP
jgi:hypothetical protein